MNLTATTHALELVTSTAIAVDYTTSFTDVDKSAATATTPGSSQGAVASATTTTIVAAPGASVFRLVKEITIRNAGASANTVTIQKDVSGTNYPQWSGTLNAGESVQYTESAGWQVYNSGGILKSAPLLGTMGNVLVNPLFSTANLTSARTITSTNTMAVYVGRAPRATSSVQTRFRVSTAAGTITWAEVAIARGTINLGGNPSLTVVGFADVAAVVNSLGQKSVTINVSAGQSINEGDDLWFLVGNQSTTALAVRAQSIADDTQVGVQAALVTRPSLNVGSAQAYTIDGPTVLAPWVAVLF